MSKKIFLITGSTGSGHILAAKAVSEALEAKGAEAKIIDAYDFVSLFKRFTYRHLYYAGVSVFPGIYNLGREIITKKNKQLEKFFKNGFRETALKMEPIFEREKPDVVLTTHPIAAGVVTHLKNKFDFKFCEACTDFSFHRFHIYKNVDFYYLPDEEIKKRIIEEGLISKEKIAVTGIPIRTVFERTFDKEKTLKELGFEKDRLTILITKGSFGWDFWGRTRRLVRGLSKSSLPIQLIMISGQNKRLFNDLKKIKFSFPAKVFGFTERMPEFMELADIEIGKPGGVFVAESLAKSLIFIIHDALPGQEEDNARFLIEKEVGRKINKACDVEKYLDSLIRNKEEMFKLQDRARFLGKPGSSRKIAGHILNEL